MLYWSTCTTAAALSRACASAPRFHRRRSRNDRLVAALVTFGLAVATHRGSTRAAAAHLLHVDHVCAVASPTSQRKAFTRTKQAIERRSSVGWRTEAHRDVAEPDDRARVAEPRCVRQSLVVRQRFDNPKLQHRHDRLEAHTRGRENTPAEFLADQGLQQHRDHHDDPAITRVLSETPLATRWRWGVLV